MSLLRRVYDDHYFRVANVSVFRKNDIRKMASLIRKYKAGGDLLEIGCGDGMLLAALKNDFRAYGVDLSASALKMSGRFVAAANLRMLDIEKDEIDGKYDIVIALNVLEHLKNPYLALARIRGALKDDGVFIFAAPNNYGLYGSIATMNMNFFDRTHVSTLRRTEWLRLFDEHKFRCIDLINGTFAGLTRNELGKHIASTFIVVLGIEHVDLY